MIVIPAIDLRGGKCVRLAQGDYARETVFGDDPVAMAERWQSEGAEWLHVVDLDGARAGRPVELATVAEIARRLAIPVELGGGLRTLDDVAAAFDAGVERVILGTVAVEAPDVLAAATRAHAGRVWVALDARDGRVAVRGWTDTSGLEVAEAARRCEDAGAAGFLHTDVSRDGTGRGVNVEATAALAESASVPVIASGGVATVDDVRRLLAVESKGIVGVVVGRALYTGAVDLAEAIAVARRDPTPSLDS
jgi:phosphoribosylformimino-5-aminoimidazole carboxamide ribotide isomerase